MLLTLFFLITRHGCFNGSMEIVRLSPPMIPSFYSTLPNYQLHFILVKSDDRINENWSNLDWFPMILRLTGQEIFQLS